MEKELNQGYTIVRGISNIFWIMGLFLVGMTVVPLIGMLPLGGDLINSGIDFQALKTNPNGRYILFYLQALAALGGFILGSFVYLKYIENAGLEVLNPNKSFPVSMAVATIFLTIIIMPFTSVLIEWNAMIKFPAFMYGFEEWASRQEEYLAEMTVFLTSFESLQEFLIALLVIAVLPAVGEELLFRGLIQRTFESFMNIHVAIWLTAFLFGALHLQFYGFVPRFLLGALFGYLYFWSGNLWMAILAHFINNGFTLFMVYLYQQKIVEYDVNTAQAMPWMYVFLSLVGTGVIIYYYRRFYNSGRSKELLI